MMGGWLLGRGWVGEDVVMLLLLLMRLKINSPLEFTKRVAVGRGKSLAANAANDFEESLLIKGASATRTRLAQASSMTSRKSDQIPISPEYLPKSLHLALLPPRCSNPARRRILPRSPLNGPPRREFWGSDLDLKSHPSNILRLNSLSDAPSTAVPLYLLYINCSEPTPPPVWWCVLISLVVRRSRRCRRFLLLLLIENQEVFAL